MKLLIFGANGLVGNTLTKYFLTKKNFETTGIVRNNSKVNLFNRNYKNHFIILDNLLDFQSIEGIIDGIKPHIIINCCGLTNKINFKNPNLAEKYIKINSLFPHKLYEICSKYETRLIHLSSDCVFSGIKGFYKENDLPDPKDIYGRSKLLGELDYKNSITIRKSVIGHELGTKKGLLEWFLSQKDVVKGFKNVIFSGLTVLELAVLIENFIIPNKYLSGLFHVSGNSISKYDLLKIIAEVYNKSIDISLDESINIDRSLNSTKFIEMTGYKIKPWPILIKSMYEFNLLNR